MRCAAVGGTGSSSGGTRGHSNDKWPTLHMRPEPGADAPLPAGEYRTEFFGGLKALNPLPVTVHVVAAKVSVRVELASDSGLPLLPPLTVHVTAG